MERPRNTLVRINLNLINLIDDQIKEYDHQLYAKMKKSVEKRGQLKNIVVCETKEGKFECLDGSKMVKIYREIGQNHIIAFNLGVLSDEEKNIVRIELSRDYFLTNYVYIGSLLKESLKTHKIEEICNILPFDKRQVEHLVSMTDFDWEAFNQTKQVEGQKSIFDLDDEVEEAKEEKEFVFPNDLETISDEDLTKNDASDLDEIFEKKTIQATSENGEKLHFDESGRLFTEGPLGSKGPEDFFVATEVEQENSMNQGHLGLGGPQESFVPKVTAPAANKVEEEIEQEEELDEDDRPFILSAITKQEPAEEPQQEQTTTESNKAVCVKLANGDLVFEGEKVMFETRKGIVSILITKISEKWVVFKDLDEDGKRKDCQVDKFIQKAMKLHEKTTQEIQEKTTEKVEKIIEEKPQPEPQPEPQVEPQVEAKPEPTHNEDEKVFAFMGTSDESENESTIEVHQEVDKVETTEQVEVVDNSAKHFYFDETRGVIVINKYADEICANLESIAKNVLRKSLNLAPDYFDNSTYTPNIIKTENETMIAHVLFVSNYGVRMFAVLKDIVNMLNTINFDE